MRSLVWLVLLTSGLALSRRANAEALIQGRIQGTVTDAATNKPLDSVTVSVTGPTLQSEQTEFTDKAGRYIITELPPGEYTVRFYFANVTTERTGVVLNADTTLTVNAKVALAQAKAETYHITERAPTVDVGNSQIQTTITDELVRDIPLNGVNGVRSYESALTLAPGSTRDAHGVSFNGGSSPENNYMLNGINTTSPYQGLLGTQTSLEFLKQTEIITAGYQAEYGRALGGVVSAVTKQGSNDWHGGFWLYYTPYSAQAQAVGRVGESITSREQIRRAFDFGFDLSGPIVKDRIWFYAGFAPTFTNDDADRSLRVRTANNATGAPGSAMGTTYGGDIDASATCPSYLPKSLCTSGGFATKALGSQYNSHYESSNRLYNYIARLDFQLDPNNHLTLQYVGSPSTRSGVADPLNGDAGGGIVNGGYRGNFNGSVGELLSSTSSQVHDVSFNFVSKALNKKLQFDVIGGFHSEDTTTTPSSSGTGAQWVDNNVLSLGTIENIAPCKPTTLANGASFNPCPVQNYRGGGLGYLQDVNATRFTVGFAATYFFRLAGTHALKAGVDYESLTLRDAQSYTGGGVDTVNPDGSVSRLAYGTSLNGTPTYLPNGFHGQTTGYNESVYVRDSYNVGFLPGLTLNLGVRFEFQQLKDINGATVISINDNIAPRLAFVYDFMRNGKSKLFFNYGRFYESLPQELSDRLFTGSGFAQQTLPAVPGQANACGASPINPSNCNFGAPSFVNGGTFGLVQPNLKGQYSNEFVVGVQYDVGFDTVLGASYVHRDLGRIIEDISPDAGGHYLIANPGDAVDSSTVKDLQAQIAKETDPTKRANLQNTLSLYQGVSSFAKPKRDYNALVLTATKRFSYNFIVLASYTYSRTLGNYPGLYQPNNGQLNPNNSTQYDLRELLVNRDGPLPEDRPHNLKIAGMYRVPLVKADKSAINIGLNFNALSGRPIEVLGSHPLYGASETFLLPRGSGGRTPTVTSFDLHLGYSRMMAKNLKMDVYWDIFNLFDQREVTDVDDNYTYDPVLPIQNGKVADLKSAKNIFGGQIGTNPNYGHATAYQSPLSMRFGVRASF